MRLHAFTKHTAADAVVQPLISARLARWLAVLAVCAVAAVFGWWVLDWHGYIQTWGGAIFRAASGGALGWAVSRYVLGLNLSEIPVMQRPIAGVSQALLVTGGAIAVAVGV